ncbi:MAG: putative manganese efflux pump MntP [Deltaproteobacteria bacterium ADurb.Bin510]|nr:MAG: putative manganese efflux pump MntP [Deltaproteobacteria bacterium ADurb.Bin510]
MSLFKLIGLALGLAMDAFAVSITSGLTMRKLKVRYALRIALFFGVFQALMPIIGYLAGLSVREMIENYDHWVAFGLLAFVGGKMLFEAIFMQEEEREINPDDFGLLLVLAIATSIDALAVGLSLSLLKIEILMPAVLIGVVTFGLSFMGVYLGKRIGHLFEQKIEILGGLVLIGIGIKILLEHLL